MPVYEYSCEACEGQFEVRRKFSDPPLEVCPECGKGPVNKLISRSSFALKGQGWYQTDYGAKKDGAPCADKGSKPSCSGCPSAD